MPTTDFCSKDWLTVTEVSRLVRLSKPTVYQLASKNQIPHYRPSGGKLLFDRAEVEAWIMAGRVESPKS